MAPNNNEDFNADELEAPAWLNNDVFLNILKHCEKTEDIELKTLTLTPASAKGDHYASVMFRVKVDYQLHKTEDKTKSMIIKTMPEYEGNKTEMFKESKIFETEIGMYTEVIPKFEAILEEAGDNTKLGAACLYHSLSPKKLIVFEDVLPLGYAVMRDREMNLTEAKATYAKIAKWHAISYKLHLEQPHIYDEFNNGIFMQPNLRDMPSFHDGLTNFIELLDEHDDLRQYKVYFEPLVGKIVDICEESFREARKNPQPHGLYGLCHGDFHHKNLMFKHDPVSRQLLDVMLLDFQMCYVGPIVNDILYSTYMLLDHNLRRNHLDEIYHFYFTTFQETLTKIGFKGEIPKMFQFRKELMRHRVLDIFMFTSFVPVWYIFADGSVDGDEILTNAETRKSAFRDPRFLKEVREMLPKYLYMGYLEN